MSNRCAATCRTCTRTRNRRPGEHRNADEQAGEHYDTALEHMNNANQWGDSVGGCFDQSDSVVEAMRAASEALNQVAAQ